MSINLKFAMFFPLLAMVLIAAFAGSLGIIFMVLEETALEELGVIILGSALVVIVPLAAYLLERNTEQA